jgi:hypothetical protein
MDVWARLALTQDGNSGYVSANWQCLWIIASAGSTRTPVFRARRTWVRGVGAIRSWGSKRPVEGLQISLAHDLLQDSRCPAIGQIVSITLESLCLLLAPNSMQTHFNRPQTCKLGEIQKFPFLCECP